MKLKFENPLYTRWYNRVHVYKKNLLIIITGETGSGKSTLGLKFCKKLDPTFSVDRVISKPKDFLNIVVNGKLKTGQAILLDEAGTVANARQWYTFNNRVISYLLQTFRYQRLIVIFTVPSFDYIDKQARYLFHYYVEAKRINFRKKLTIAKVMRLQYNALTGKLYRKYLRFIINGDYCKVINFYFKKPSKELCDAYEKKARKFKHDLAVEMYEAIKKLEVKMASSSVDLYKKAIDIVETFDEDVIKSKGDRTYANLHMLEQKYHLSPSKAKNLKALIDTILQKGFWEEGGKIKKIDYKDSKSQIEASKDKSPKKPKVMFNICEVCGMTITKGFESMASPSEKCKDGHKWKY